MLYKVSIQALSFDAVIGILEHERQKAQALIINCDFAYEYKSDFINYAIVADLIEKIMKKEAFFLLEEALEYLIQVLHKKFPEIKKIKLEITKPNILEHAKVSVTLKKRFLQ